MSLRIRIAFLFTLIILLFLSQFFWDIETYFKPKNIVSWLEVTGLLAPLVYMGIMALAVIISPIPSLPLDLAAGAFFGPFLGTLYSVIGALCGAVISFTLSRYLGRGIVERFLKGHIHFCIECSDRLLTKIVFFSRLLPIISFDVVSYGAGLTKMSLKKFAIATFFGMIPLTFIYNFFGSVLVFGKVLSVFFGFMMVLLFFLIPKWLEQRPSFQKFSHHIEPVNIMKKKGE